MKKTYAASTLVTSGDVVRETKSGNPGPEIGSTGVLQAPGSVGFHL
jgi:hypothetical protein